MTSKEQEFLNSFANNSETSIKEKDKAMLSLDELRDEKLKQERIEPDRPHEDSEIVSTSEKDANASKPLGQERQSKRSRSPPDNHASGSTLVDRSITGSSNTYTTESTTFSSSSDSIQTQFKSNNPFAQHFKGNSNDNSLKNFTFKTLNRIIDDIKLDIPAILSGLPPLLRSKPISYSESIANIHVNPYQIIVLNNLLDYAPNVQSKEYDGFKITTIRGLIRNSSEVKLSTSKVYHLKIRIVDRGIISSQKHQFHEIPNSLIPASILQELNINLDDLDSHSADFEDPKNKEHVVKSVPNFIDIANFECAKTKRIIRIEISSPEFSEETLSAFEIGAIQERYTKAQEMFPELPQEIPTPVICLFTFYKVLKGPLSLQEGEDTKTIQSSNSALSSQIELKILFEELYFDSTPKELIPPNFYKYGKYNDIVRDSYFRKLFEIIYLGKKAFTGGKPNQFINFSFSDNNSFILRAFHETDYEDALNYQTYGSKNSVPYINMSACDYFSDDMIKKCYEATVASDPSNEMYYIDSLKDLIYKRKTPNLQIYFSKVISNENLIGYRDLMAAYKVLKIEPTEIPNVTDDLIIAMYKAELELSPSNYNYLRKNLKYIAIGRRSSVIETFLDNELLPFKLAYDNLNCEEVTEDEVLLTAYQFKKDDFPEDTQILNRSLLSIAIGRKSYLLLDYIETNLPELSSTMPILNYEESCKVLECDSMASDFQIMTIFQIRLQQESANVLLIRHALKNIAIYRSSSILSGFLRTGIVDPKLLPSENWPIGLDNIGNTCYLNSLLQYYFVIKPLRDRVLYFSEYSIDKNSEVMKNRRIGGRIVTEEEVVRSYQFVYQLRDLFDDMIHSSKRCIPPKKELAYLAFSHISEPVQFKGGQNPDTMKDSSPMLKASELIENSNCPSYKNSGIEPQMNTIDEVTLSTPYTADIEINKDEDHEMEEVDVLGTSATPVSDSWKKDKDGDLIHYDLDSTSSNMLNINKDRPAVSEISLDQMENALEIGRQQDVTECIENVMGQFETAFEPEKLEEGDNNEQYDFIKYLFYGKLKQTLTPISGASKERQKIERFSNLIINITDDPKDLYDALDNYFNEDIVTLGGEQTKKVLTISELPQFFQIQINRVFYDPVKMRPYKSIAPVPFGEKLFLDRYLDTEDENVISKRNEVFKWKAEINKLKIRKTKLSVKNAQDMTIREALVSTRDFLEQELNSSNDFGVKPETVQTLDEQICSISNELNGINNRLAVLKEKVDNQFQDYKKVGYSIVAIFIHRGEASYGHYWIYIRDPKTNVYRKYNDETVTEVPITEVFNFQENNTATPYFIVYVKDEFEEEYIEPLKREIESSEV